MGERLQKEPTLLMLWFWTSKLQNCEETNVCGWSCPVCGNCHDNPSKLTGPAPHPRLRKSHVPTWQPTHTLGLPLGRTDILLLFKPCVEHVFVFPNEPQGGDRNMFWKLMADVNSPKDSCPFTAVSSISSLDPSYVANSLSPLKWTWKIKPHFLKKVYFN